MGKESKNISLKAILIIIGLGIWIIVLQNAGVIPTKQDVYVKGGYVDVDNTVRVKGSVDVTGSVEVDNMVDVNLNVLNRPVGSHRSYIIEGREYQAIDVFQSNK